MSRPGGGSLVEGSDGDYIWHPAAIQIALDADAEIAALRESLRAILYQYTFCVDTDPEDADIAKASALLGEGGGS
jgi:hypothetical protein